MQETIRIETHALPRAEGLARVEVGKDGRLDALRQSASLKLLFPRVDGSAKQAVLVNMQGEPHRASFLLLFLFIFTFLCSFEQACGFLL